MLGSARNQNVPWLCHGTEEQQAVAPPCIPHVGGRQPHAESEVLLITEGLLDGEAATVELGRKDPIGFLGGLNAYAFFPNTVNAVDRAGLSSAGECGAAFACLAALGGAQWRYAGTFCFAILPACRDIGEPEPPPRTTFRSPRRARRRSVHPPALTVLRGVVRTPVACACRRVGAGTEAFPTVTSALLTTPIGTFVRRSIATETSDRAEFLICTVKH